MISFPVAGGSWKVEACSWDGSSQNQAGYKALIECLGSLMLPTRRLLLVFLFGALALGAIGTYATVIEPNNLRLTEITLSFADLPVAADGLLVAHISDLHMNRVGPRERRILRILEKNPPDIVAITGDQISNIDDKDACLELLGHLHARLGIWAVQGNWEHYTGWVGKRSREDLTAVNVTLLINEAEELKEAGIWIAGTDDPSLEKDSLTQTLEGTAGFVVLLAHSPAIMKRASGGVDLILAGHTHGGQVRFPLIGAPWGTRVGGGYNYGLYEENETVMYVTRGVGMAHLPIRFLCPPEMAYITLRREVS
jgi:predicted MPP superfamily phosphohydrolase